MPRDINKIYGKRAKNSISAYNQLKWEDVELPNAEPVLKAIEGLFFLLDDHNMQLTRNQKTTDQKYYILIYS